MQDPTVRDDRHATQVYVTEADLKPCSLAWEVIDVRLTVLVDGDAKSLCVAAEVSVQKTTCGLTCNDCSKAERNIAKPDLNAIELVDRFKDAW